ncbi:hypothetical protein WICMUC_000054 [Wickerhamomyces mucosus]|uniref:Elongator complex protein 4 n=1 Tax=Wickerhamomyces mucosus TaxID=1378264 RepID=A0A9P8TJA1_9ASCO|nr:hypothetical protein WICMUC_000054 [Wickerhamomyces mucosus]
MSFRKRGEIISNGGKNTLPNNRIPNAVPGRGSPITSSIPRRGNIPLIPNRGQGTQPIPGRTQVIPNKRNLDLNESFENLQIKENEELSFKFPKILKPSSLNSSMTISTGISDLDKILGHQGGIPLGSSLLIEENGSTDFSSILLKAFASQGIIHNRLNPQQSNTHLVVLTSNIQWGKDLPGVYRGSSRQIKKQAIRENEEKLSIQNLVNKPQIDKDLRIAWRYGLNDSNKREIQEANDEIYKDFNHQFDITSRLNPLVQNNEISYIPISNNFIQLYQQIVQVLESQKNKIIRLIIPSILNPSMYSPQLTQLTEILPFIHKLRSLTHKYPQLIIISSIPLDLYSKSSIIVKSMESLFDTVIQLEPFNQQMLQFLERAYKNEPNKISHGLLHIFKLNNQSDAGQMLITKNEYSFKNGRKKFEIEEWGIPVDDDATTAENDENKQTTKDIDF